MLADIVVRTGETAATVYTAATVQCRTCRRSFGALSRRLKPSETPSDEAVRQAFAVLFVSLGGVAEVAARCSYCASGGRPPRDMRSWELRTDPAHLPPARGGWLDWDGEEAEDDDAD